MIEIQKLYLLVPLAPLVGSLIAGLLGRVIGTTWSHRITIGMMFVCWQRLSPFLWMFQREISITEVFILG